MRYAIWNNKGGVGKTYLSFVLATEYARRNPNKKIVVVDMCPQANLSEILLGGNGTGERNLGQLLAARKTVGGYFDERTRNPHNLTGNETGFLVEVSNQNPNLPKNLYLLAGDPSLEIQAQVINQLSNVALPQDSWKSIHYWLKDLVIACSQKLGGDAVTTFIDCNPSFSAYTELALVVAENIIIPCSADGSSARAIDNIAQLVYGVNMQSAYSSVTFKSRCEQFGVPLPLIHSLVLNRSTQYSNKASKAFTAMFNAIREKYDALKQERPGIFAAGHAGYFDVPDNHSVALVSSHLGKPLYEITPGKYEVYDSDPQINNEPLDRYKDAVEKLVRAIQ